MGRQEEIRDALARHAGKYGPVQTMLATVKSVNETEFSCTLVDDDQEDLEYPDVRLCPVLDGNESVTVFPKLGTWALVIRVEDSEDWMLIACGECDKWRVKIGTAIIEQDSTGLEVKKGTDTLKEVIQMIIEATQQITVLYGNNPDYSKLGQAMVKLNNILR